MSGQHRFALATALAEASLTPQPGFRITAQRAKRAATSALPFPFWNGNARHHFFIRLEETPRVNAFSFIAVKFSRRRHAAASASEIGSSTPQRRFYFFFLYGRDKLATMDLFFRSSNITTTLISGISRECQERNHAFNRNK